MTRVSLLRHRASELGAMKQLPKPQRAVGLFRATHPDMAPHPVRVKWVKLPKASGRGFVSLGGAIPHKVPVWAQCPDDGGEPLVPVTKRRMGVPVLVKIAAQLLKKRKRTEPNATSAHSTHNLPNMFKKGLDDVTRRSSGSTCAFRKESTV